MQEKLNAQGLTESEFLQQYDAGKFERPSVTVDTLIFTVSTDETQDIRRLPDKELRILLIKRGDHPYIGQWALPGGFVQMDENLDEAAARELKEETGVENVYMEQLYTYGNVNRDPRTRIIGTTYIALVDSSSLVLQAGDDAADARWFSVSTVLFSRSKTRTEQGYIVEEQRRLTLKNEEQELSAIIKVRKITEGNVTKIIKEIADNTGIAFDHAQIIDYGVERLKNKINYTDIAFSLMPALFTLTDLQQVYEVILGRELLKANFRRKIAPMVTETNETVRDYAHRPSKLYKFNPDWAEEDF